MPLPGISAVLITRNEAENLPATLSALNNVVDEIIVVDSFSTDSTCAISRSFGAKVYEREWEGFSLAKNYGNRQCSYSHILSIDADEVLDEELQRAILNLKASGFSGAYRLNRKNILEGIWIKHSGWYPDRKVRLFPSRKAKWVGNYVHEELSVDKDVPVADLPGHLIHHTARTREEHLHTIHKYNELQARKLYEQKRSYPFLKSLGSALSVFIRCILIRQGFLDGRAGWKIAFRSALGRIWRYKSYQKLIREA